MIIDSGKRVLHSFWDVRGFAEPVMDRLKRRAYARGACDSTMQNRAQLVRVPDAIRPETG
jgi:hypothetical protein